MKQVVTSAQGCRDSSLQTIQVLSEKAMLTVPNSFTPNSHGFNDNFAANSSGIKEFKSTIFNRWENQVFITEDLQIKWDGTSAGKNLPEDVNFYVIKTSGLKGEALERRGDLTLKRN
jgi:gliding motility-associated-like protein